MEFRIATLLMGIPLGTSVFGTGAAPKEEFDPKDKDNDNDSDPTTYNPLYDSYNVPYDPSSYTSFSPGMVSITSVLLLVAELVLYILLGSLSAWLSWTSNTTLGWHPLFRVIFAIFAFIFSVTYVLSHIVFKLDILAALRLARGLAQSQVTVVRNNTSKVAQTASANGLQQTPVRTV